MSRDFEHEGLAFETNHHIGKVVDFDYDAIDQNVFDVNEAFPHSSEAQDLAVRMLIRFKSWDFQDGMKDKRGLMIRSTVSAWAILPNLRLLTLSQLSRGLDLEKQSIGRWVDDFKKRFPHIRNNHMKL